MKELPKKISSRKPRRSRPVGKAIKCTDQTGHVYDSLLEMDVTHEFERYANDGLIANLNKQVCFNFKEIIKPPMAHSSFIRTYTADFTFDCKKSFQVMCLKPAGRGFTETYITFESGKSYVVDVKSPLTYKMPLWRFKKALMKATWGVSVVELIRRHPRKTGSSKRKTRKSTR